MMIGYKKENRVAIIATNRPEALGAISLEGFKEFNDALIDFRDDDGLWVGIITGTGDKTFSCGVDISEVLPFIKSAATRPWQQQLMTRVLRGIGLDLWKPLIAALNGLTLGGAFALALCCDIRIASENAKFGFPEVRVGMLGGSQRLPRRVPYGIAAEMIFTGKMIDAQEAYRIGLVNRVVSLDKLLPTAKEVAQSICEAAPLAVRASKEAMVRGTGMSLEDGERLEMALTPQIVNSKDFEEGITAFAEKRKPNFEGR
jgi:enoyl-CoA hydratase/carnithine racemase